MKANILEYTSKKTLIYITKFVQLDKTAIIATNTILNIENILEKQNYIVNLKRVNDFKNINRYFKSINNKLHDDGVFINIVETYTARKNRILKKFFFPLNYIYYFFDFILTRITPKLSLTKGLYKFLSGGKRRVLSKTEVFGRLYYCGFELQDYKSIDNKLVIVAIKKKECNKIEKHNYGILIKLKRVGFKGNLIKVSKIRTMHPYSQYIQKYMFEKYGSITGDKIIGDYRIPAWGKLIRKFWIDEIPMIINLLKFELKIVGVRPLSESKFYSYPKELQELRIKVKPGLLPPYYADNPTDIEGFYLSEEKYLNAYLKNPIKTDLKYFFKIVNNILFKGKRSA